MNRQTASKLSSSAILLALSLTCFILIGRYLPASASKLAPVSEVKRVDEANENNLVGGTAAWSLGDEARGDSLIYKDGVIEVSPGGANQQGQRLIVRHAVDAKFSKTEEGQQRSIALHVHLQARCDVINDIGIELLFPEYPYPHALSETRQIGPGWKTFDFDCVTSENYSDAQSLFIKILPCKGKTYLKDIRVNLEALSAISVSPGDLTDAGIQKNIDKNRMGDIDVQVRDKAGRPVANQAVRIAQTSRAFLFGTEAQGLKPKDDSELQKSYRKHLLSVFNFATVTPYWPQVEKNAGHPDYTPFDDQIDWLAKHHFMIKITPAFWPHWTPDYVPRETIKAQAMVDENLEQFAKHFAPSPVTYVENNEVAAALTDSTSNGLISLVREKGPVKVLEDVASIEKKWLTARPAKLLIYNDYEDGQTEFDMLDQLKKNGTLPDALGVEMHMTQGEWPLERVLHIIERLSKYGKPIYVSEISIVSGDHRCVQFGPIETSWNSTEEGEARQANYVEKLYKVLFSNKHVHGITWWDLTDKDAWQGAPRGLLRKDMTPKPAFERLEKLINGSWQTNEVAHTDANGNCLVRAFAGNYQISAINKSGNVEPGASTRTVSVQSSGKPTKVVLTCGN